MPKSHRPYPAEFRQRIIELVRKGMTDSSGEWQVVGRPYTTAGGKNSHVRVQRVDKPGVTETRLWGSYEKVAVIRRASAEEGKP